MRYLVFITLLALFGLIFEHVQFNHHWMLVPLGALLLVGAWDFVQKRHSLLRNYPLVGHLRWLSEAVRPQVQQYFVEGDTEGKPFSRNERSVVYERAKNIEDAAPFGTELDVYGEGYEWLNHAIVAKPVADTPYRTIVGNAQCAKPYAASGLNISAMSFGALGPAAVRALNKGAAKGGFAHDTGEGGISRYHLEFGADLIWEIGTGYFGCRDHEGGFDPARFAEQAQREPVKMIELKLSQGAKPGHGGVLPAAKITEEIAAAREIPRDRDCVSPAAHSAFSTPIEMLEFLARMRELSGGKPVGFKLCVGHPWEFLAICKAMLDTEIHPDFIVVDGNEGGTGAAPMEFPNYMGTPLHEGLLWVHNALVGCNLREHIKIGAAGKLITGFRMASAMALGADWCNAARPFMFALGCVQSQRCHTNHCPTSVATQDPWRQRALDVPGKAERVYHYHCNTLRVLAGIVAAAGLDHPGQLQPRHIYRRVDANKALPLDALYDFVAPGALLDGTADPSLITGWRSVSAQRFDTG
ncbi:FMN-binding glutamate synthase family protein [Salinisphaera hydrothermalis]|uniref:FMN-binding glutamate synthase family protein n=1 Tax=Salinisphaera hydrothermalis TaxID=563188 RepID=UPI0033402791